MESMYYNFHYCSCFAQKEERQEAVIDALCGLFGDNAKDQLIQYEDHDWGKEPYNGGCPVSTMQPGCLIYFHNALREPFGRYDGLFFVWNYRVVT